LISLDNLELEKQIIFNPTHISKLLSTLVSEKAVHDAEIRISLSGPTIFEKIINSQDDLTDQANTQQLKNLVWHQTPVFQNAQDHQQLYVCGISRELLFQYRLFAIKHHLNLSCLTTRNQALLSTYQSLASVTNKYLATPEDIALTIPTQLMCKLCTEISSSEDPLLMAELIGLCIAEITYEDN
jgi:uncharacterized protein YlaN (UPF0358 family)